MWCGVAYLHTSERLLHLEDETKADGPQNVWSTTLLSVLDVAGILEYSTTQAHVGTGGVRKDALPSSNSDLYHAPNTFVYDGDTTSPIDFDTAEENLCETFFQPEACVIVAGHEKDRAAAR